MDTDYGCEGVYTKRDGASVVRRPDRFLENCGTCAVIQGRPHLPLGPIADESSPSSVVRRAAGREFERARACTHEGSLMELRGIGVRMTSMPFRAASWLRGNGERRSLNVLFSIPMPIPRALVGAFREALPVVSALGTLVRAWRRATAGCALHGWRELTRRRTGD